MTHLRTTIILLALAVLLALSSNPSSAHAQTLTVLHTFTGGTDGLSPSGGLIRDKYGNLYGTTYNGGDGGCLSYGCGIIFKVKPSGEEKILYKFNSKTGELPASRLFRDAAGNLYGGTTRHFGTIFRLSESPKTLTTLHTFAAHGDGADPRGQLIQDAQGNLYGTSFGFEHGCGTVFKIDGTGNMTILRAFSVKEGCSPWGGLVLDAAGNLYGTTERGGDTSCNCGVVFKLSNTGQETVLYRFMGGSDGSSPLGPLVSDAEGNFYGITGNDGEGDGCCGTVFKIDPNGAETILYRFQGGADGGFPSNGGLIRDKQGNLYGATTRGRNGNPCQRGHFQSRSQRQ